MDVIIYHNPDCGTSRNTLAMIRNALLHEKGTPFQELGLGNPDLSDDELLDAMMAHPILINRPIVVTPNGVRLCRPSEKVIDLLPLQRNEFVKEDGDRVIDPRNAEVT
jgi:arsenate reductase